MKQIIAMILAGATALFIGACGGGGGSSTPIDDGMTSKDAVFIMYHYPSEVCESNILLNELQIALPEAYNWLVSSASNSITCATYGKTDGVDCMTEDYALIDPTAIEYDTSCVIGFDIDTGLMYTKVIGDTDNNAPEWSEDVSLATKFATDAQ